MLFALTIIGGYFLGSIPFGLILTRLGGYGDIRDIGSGNIGATNVLRTGNKKLALATLILDGLKGVLAVVLAYYLVSLFPHACTMSSCAEGATDCGCPDYIFWKPDLFACLAGFFAIIGHLFPVWLKFKGGKGVATTLGTLIALHPVVGVTACGVWLASAVITRYSSLSAILAVANAPLISFFLGAGHHFTALCAAMAALVIFKHKANIQRLLKGEEPKIGQKK